MNILVSIVFYTDQEDGVHIYLKTGQFYKCRASKLYS